MLSSGCSSSAVSGWDLVHPGGFINNSVMPAGIQPVPSGNPGREPDPKHQPFRASCFCPSSWEKKKIDYLIPLNILVSVNMLLVQWK